jgi:hypothetical protein
MFWKFNLKILMSGLSGVEKFARELDVFSQDVAT